MKKIINTNIGLVIICLFTAVFVMADFIVIDKVLDSYVVNEKNNNKDYNKDNTVTEDVNDSNNDISEATLKNIIEEQLFVVFRYDQLVEKKEDIDNQSKLFVASIILEDEYTFTTDGVNTEIISFKASKLEETFDSSSIGYLGIHHENFGKYNLQDTGTSYYNNGLFSKEWLRYKLPVASIVKSYEKKSNQYIISMNYLFADAEYVLDSEYYYGSVVDEKNKTNPIVKSCEVIGEVDIECLDAQEYLDSNYNNIKDSLTTYTYIFEKQNGKIILTDFSID